MRRVAAVAAMTTAILSSAARRRWSLLSRAVATRQFRERWGSARRRCGSARPRGDQPVCAADQPVRAPGLPVCAADQPVCAADLPVANSGPSVTRLRREKAHEIQAPLAASAARYSFVLFSSRAIKGVRARVNGRCRDVDADLVPGHSGHCRPD